MSAVQAVEGDGNASGPDDERGKLLTRVHLASLVSLVALALPMEYGAVQLIRGGDPGAFTAVAAAAGALVAAAGLGGAAAHGFQLAWVPLPVVAAGMAALGCLASGVSCTALALAMGERSPVAAAVERYWANWLQEGAGACGAGGCAHPCPRAVSACAELADLPPAGPCLEADHHWASRSDCALAIIITRTAHYERFTMSGTGYNVHVTTGRAGRTAPWRRSATASRPRPRPASAARGRAASCWSRSCSCSCG